MANSMDGMVGDRIRQRRLALHLSLEQVADHLGVPVEGVEKFEAGSDRVGAEMLIRLCSLLNVSMAYFFSNNPI
jgi:transcriptional regulator with XRE-family HTH domain